MKFAVTGGSGFVGKALCTTLARQGHHVIAISRRKSEFVESDIHSVRHDLGEVDEETLARDLRGCDGVFHVAAKVDLWGPYSEFYRANVIATRKVISACRRAGVRRLVFTSSPSVIADGRSLRGVDESYPYPRRYYASYPRTKAEAERLVLECSDLWCCSLRPHLIFGPGDSHLVPTIVERARIGRLTRVGQGLNRVDLTYIDDCVAAHIKACEALESNPAIRGRAYFISQGDPVLLWDWIDEVLRRSGAPSISRSVSVSAAKVVASLSEMFSRLDPKRREPFLTRFVVSELSTDHYFDISAAKRDLLYQPRYTVDEAMRLTFSAASQQNDGAIGNASQN